MPLEDPPAGDSTAALDRMSEIADARGKELIDSTIEAARELLGMHLSFVSELTPDKQIYRFVAGDAASFGLTAGHVAAHEHGYCVRMVDGLIPNVVPDVRADARTRDLLATLASDVGAYVGVPIRLSDGRLYGSFCCLDHDARPELGLSARGVMALLARLISDELEREIVLRQKLRLEIEASTSQALVTALQARESYTGEHSKAVLELSLALGRQLGLSAAELQEVGLVAVLHDLGKVGVPDNVLNKRGPLDDAEHSIMRTHPEIGARIVASVDGLAHVAPAVRAEHERWDGTGYPDRLAGEEIPLASRICLVCDAYDAMTTDRPYRRALGSHEALSELSKGAGTQFDPRLVQALLELLRAHPLTHAAAADATPRH